MNILEHSFFDKTFQYKNISSTSVKAEELIKDGNAKGHFLVTALSQKTGTGRKGATWHSPEGGIWMTAGLYNLQVEVSLTLFVGIILHKTILKICPELKGDLKIKWPNDIYVRDKKICGVISNFMANYKYHLIGIGIDTNIAKMPVELTNIASSILLETSRKIDNTSLVIDIFNSFASELPEFINNGLKSYKKYYEENSYLKGKEIVLDTEFKKFQGKMKGINSKGALLLQISDDMVQPLYSGSVIFVGE